MKKYFKNYSADFWHRNLILKTWFLQFLRDQKNLEEVFIKKSFDYKLIMGKCLLTVNLAKLGITTVDTLILVLLCWFFSYVVFSIADPQDEQNGQKTLAEDGLVFRSPEMKRSLQRPNKKKKMSKKSKHNRPQDRAPSHPKSNSSSTDDSDNSDSFYETLRRHQRKHRTSKNTSSNSISVAKK